jgi:MoaE-MoaD fusion protein
MRVRVLFFGVLKDIVGRSEEFLEIGENATLATVFESYSQRFETLRGKRSSILFARNHEFTSPETRVTDNDEIAFLPPVSGGSNTSGASSDHTFAITHDLIDIRQLVQAVQRPEDGAVVTFEGVVRNNTKGRETTHLDYECYEPMALAGMKRIGQEVAAHFAIGRIGIVHRLGRLQVGEASVAVVASAPHRRPAFEAALEAIDRLKREVPIWKKEYFADGAVWVEGEWDERLLSGPVKHAE